MSRKSGLVLLEVETRGHNLLQDLQIEHTGQTKVGCYTDRSQGHSAEWKERGRVK